jgi:hypothetical protein
MSTNIVDTIMIGAGISGLACAKTLQQNDRDFILISKDIGGRIRTSPDGSANYGAFFVCSDYDHVLQHVTIQTRIKLRDFCFHHDTTYVLFEPMLIPYVFQFMKTIRLLHTFRRHFRQFRKTCEQHSQKTAIENDPFLYELYKQNAAEFVKDHHLEKGTQRYLSQALYSTTFSQIKEMNALSFFEFLLPLITPIYLFRFEQEKMIAPFKDRIVIGSVQDVTYNTGMYKIGFDGKSLQAKHLVLATDIGWSKHIAGIQQTNEPVSTNMLHIRGIPTAPFSKKIYHFFTPPGNVQALANLQDGTALLYYKNERPRLNDFFTNPEVIAHHHWDPAGTINGHTLIESNRGNNLYLIGDYNIAGLEEAYITGVYAANQIIRKA